MTKPSEHHEEATKTTLQPEDAGLQPRQWSDGPSQHHEEVLFKTMIELLILLIQVGAS